MPMFSANRVVAVIESHLMYEYTMSKVFSSYLKAIVVCLSGSNNTLFKNIFRCLNLCSDTFIMEYVGEVLDHRQFRKRARKYASDDVQHFYFMALSSEYFIDASSKGNISRFINHSCDPNAETQKVSSKPLSTHG